MTVSANLESFSSHEVQTVFPSSFLLDKWPVALVMKRESEVDEIEKNLMQVLKREPGEISDVD